jgi:lipopolysaccharide transport system permease protein
MARLWSVLAALWTSRALAWRLFQRNLAANYRQSLLGWLWIFLTPLATAGVWVFLNASGTLPLSPLGVVGYAAFVFTGLMLWQGFLDGLTGPMNTLLANRAALTKLQFPREVFITLSLWEASFDFLARWIVAAVFLAVAGLAHPFGLLALALLWGPLLLILGTGIGLWLAPFGLLYKDVSRSIALVSPLWMLLTPVIYALPAGTTGSLMTWINPPAAMIEVARVSAIAEPLAEDPTATPATTATAQQDRAAANQATASAVPGSTTQRPAEERVAVDAGVVDAGAADQGAADQGAVDAGAVKGSTVQESAVEQANGGTPAWVPAVMWGLIGLGLFVLGALWLDVSGPIIIERLAN